MCVKNGVEGGISWHIGDTGVRALPSKGFPIADGLWLGCSFADRDGSLFGQEEKAGHGSGTGVRATPEPRGGAAGEGAAAAAVVVGERCGAMMMATGRRGGGAFALPPAEQIDGFPPIKEDGDGASGVAGSLPGGGSAAREQ